MADALVDYVRRELTRHADARKAPLMAAYMKTDMPFYGVQRPARALIAKEIIERFPIESAKQYCEAILALWNQPHREEKYLAINIATAHSRFITLGSLPLYRRLIIEGAWWDFVDDVSINLVGRVALNDRDRTFTRIDSWIDHPNLWLRRSAIICQIKHKSHTDQHRLFDYCLRRAGERECFIRKAIGWALREHAKKRPASVRRFLMGHKGKLSPLSVREASKHL